MVNGLFSRIVELDIFSGFRVCSLNLVVSHLQYADDTLIMVDPSVENLWLIKTILKGFQIASSLRNNFVNSSLIEVIVDPILLDLTGDFLYCELEILLFRCLGLSVGVNSYFEVTKIRWLIFYLGC